MHVFLWNCFTGSAQLLNYTDYQELQTNSQYISGARSNNTSILAKLQELNTASEAFSNKSGELDKVMKELENCKKVAGKYEKIMFNSGFL